MQNKILVNSLLVIIILGLSACADEYEIDLSDQKIETRFRRFDRDFFRTDTTRFEEELAALKKQYPFFFMNDGTTQFWKNQRTEPLQIELYQKAQSAFADMETQNQRLNLAMKRYYHFFGTKDTLQFYSYISRLDFNFPVLFADSVVFAALDLYLGNKSKYYQRMPRYLAYYRQPKFLVRDCMQAVVEPRAQRKKKGETLLDAMVYFGKIYYMLHRVLPEETEADLLKYPPEKFAFAREREKVMWIYFIENNLLFSTDQESQRRFIDPAPFSKFRTKMDANTPGRIGHWFGFEIVKAFMTKNNNYTLQQLLAEDDSQKILRLSGYKP